MTHVRSAGAASPSVFGEDPAGAVARLSAAGAHWVHLVDLDRAYGTGSNRDVVRRVLARAPLLVQIGGALGGGNDDPIDEMLAWGAARVVIGCGAAVLEPALVGRLVSRYGPGRLAVGVDARAGLVSPRSGPEVPSVAVLEFARRVRDQGAGTVVYTDVSRDGTLHGPDLDGARAIAALGLHVVAGGGVGSLADVRAVRDARLAGAIVGRALHEGRFTVAEALACTTA